MFVELRYTLRRFRGQIIGWGLGLALYSLMMVSMYADIAKIDFAGYLNAFPQEMLAFFGDSFDAITSPHGYIDLYFFNYMTIIVGIFAVGAGAKLIVKDEEDGLLDLILAYPKSRSALFWGRVFAFVVTLVLIMLISWLSWVIPSGSSSMNLSAWEILRPFWGLMSQLLLFGSFALFLSMILPASRLASMITGGLLVANYLVIGLANINQDLEKIVKYTPLHIYQGGYAILGIEWDSIVIILEGAILFLLIAWWRFLLRDLRVAGEGGWKLKEIMPFRKS
jgi:ABC-2 type transport system permease protein